MPGNSEKQDMNNIYRNPIHAACAWLVLAAFAATRASNTM